RTSTWMVEGASTGGGPGAFRGKLWTDDLTARGRSLVDLSVRRDEGEPFLLGEPDIDRIRSPQTRGNGHRLDSLRALRADGHDGCVREEALDESIDLGRPEARPRQRRRDLDTEDRRYDDRVESLQEGRQKGDRRAMVRLVRPKRRHRYGGVEHILHRRPRTRSSTAAKFGSPHWAASWKNARTSSSVMAFARAFFGTATSTGTIAAAGFPWRRITMRFFLCSAWSTSSDRCALASARDLLITMTIMTISDRFRQVRGRRTLSSGATELPDGNRPLAARAGSPPQPRGHRVPGRAREAGAIGPRSSASERAAQLSPGFVRGYLIETTCSDGGGSGTAEILRTLASETGK